MNNENALGQKESVAAGCAPARGSVARLWRVTVEYELLVVADSEREAESEAEFYAKADGADSAQSTAYEVRTARDIPTEWKDALPFGGDKDDERTCTERVTQNC